MQEYKYTVKSADVLNNILYVEYSLLSNIENKIVVGVPMPPSNSQNLDYYMIRYYPFDPQQYTDSIENDFENGL